MQKELNKQDIERLAALYPMSRQQLTDLVDELKQQVFARRRGDVAIAELDSILNYLVSVSALLAMKACRQATTIRKTSNGR
jgi:hypothetical protein